MSLLVYQSYIHLIIDADIKTYMYNFSFILAAFKSPKSEVEVNKGFVVFWVFRSSLRSWWRCWTTRGFRVSSWLVYTAALSGTRVLINKGGSVVLGIFRRNESFNFRRALYKEKYPKFKAVTFWFWFSNKNRLRPIHKNILFRILWILVINLLTSQASYSQTRT